MAASLRTSKALKSPTSRQGWAYLLALGSNQRHHRHGAPRDVLKAAVEAMREAGLTVLAVAPVVESAPIGPSWRRYANGAALVRADMMPPQMLRLLQQIEADFGRKRARRWGTRVLDLDIVLWEGGCWRSGGAGRRFLSVPHAAFRQRGFVLGPAMAIAPLWRDPVTGFTLRQLHSRLTRRAHALTGAHPDSGSATRSPVGGP